MAGATGKAAAQVNARSRSPGREDLAGGFFVLINTQSTTRIPSRAQPETTMTKRIRTGTTLKDMTRRDFLVSSAMTAGLFVAARKLFPSGA
ncbi:twin-arginine translocation signal domain-containing protein, partial [Mesorhizobium sp. M7A.F.Ca.US.011.01.1.1]|uniref:twin-arginine translocation signal domain-containing protein n=1 Tax=Mesorhizobium sp. M7A.F.Ca.US.011.01.1.1 TaxID=2496741 RepID=UPI001FE08600